MASKRSLEDDSIASQPKKARTGFKVGPDNLPDGTWRRKVVKIKKDLIHKAKIKKSYAKLKARAPIEESRMPAETTSPAEPTAEPSQELHPERQAMLDAPEEPEPPLDLGSERRPRERRTKRPKYFEKQQAFAEQQKAEAEAKRAEFERRGNERRLKIEERERFRRAMAKARSGGKNGQRKLGKESKVLLDRVKKIVGE